VRSLNVAEVLERCQLGTRAFYRHFESKDQLVAAVFTQAAITETRRLRRKMSASATAVDAVAAWIDARLDVAFDNRVSSGLRQVSLEAQTLMFNSPELVQPAFGTILKPLVEQLERGLREGVFHDIDPPTDAEIVQGAVWACTQRQWRREIPCALISAGRYCAPVCAHWAPPRKRSPKSSPLEMIRKPAHEQLRHYPRRYRTERVTMDLG